MGRAIILVDADPASRATRRGQLEGHGTHQVITAADAADLAEALHLVDPELVIVSVVDPVLAARLVRTVRAQCDAHPHPVPLLVWPSPEGASEAPAGLLEAGADAVVPHDASLADLLDAACALRRTVAPEPPFASLPPMPLPVLDTLRLSVALYETGGRVLHANAAFQRLWRELTGLHASPVGGTLAEWIVGGDRAAFADLTRALFAAPAGAAGDLACTMGTSPARGVPVQMHLVRLDDPAAGPLIVAQVTDGREQRRETVAERDNRWHALDQQQIFEMSAQLRNLLSVVSQAVETRRDDDVVRDAGVPREVPDVLLPPAQVALLRHVLTQSERVIEGMQAIASGHAHPDVLLDVPVLVRSYLELFRQMLPTQIALSWEIPDGGLLVRGGEAQLQQVLTILMMNAWDAQPGGGTIHVRVRGDDDVVVIAVEDDGPGVPEEKHDWIFLPMTSTRNAEGASGNGLSTARRTVELHGGQLSLDRHRSAGARFDVTLPRYRASAP